MIDTFGPKYAATNYGFLYVAEGVGSILGGPAAAFLKQATGSYYADDGRFYTSNISLAQSDTLRVEVCVGPFCGGENWLHVTP